MFGLPPTTIPSYPTTPESRQVLIGHAFQLLSEATPQAPHPVAMVELPKERKVVVAELGQVTSTMPPEQLYAMRLGLARETGVPAAQDLAADWSAPTRSAAAQLPPAGRRAQVEDDRTKTASAD
jgi:hypothetical protein